MASCRPVACVQCGTELRGTAARAVTVVVGTRERAYPACRDQGACRDRWWARFAYEMELT